MWIIRKRNKSKILSFVHLSRKLIRNTPPQEVQLPMWRITVKKYKDYKKVEGKNRSKKKLLII